MSKKKAPESIDSLVTRYEALAALAKADKMTQSDLDEGEKVLEAMVKVREEMPFSQRSRVEAAAQAIHQAVLRSHEEDPGMYSRREENIFAYAEEVIQRQYHGVVVGMRLPGRAKPMGKQTSVLAMWVTPVGDFAQWHTATVIKGTDESYVVRQRQFETRESAEEQFMREEV